MAAASAMHHDRSHSDGFHKNDVGQDVFQRLAVLHDAATQLDHRCLTAELADPSQGFDQDVGFFDGVLQWGPNRDLS